MNALRFSLLLFAVVLALAGCATAPTGLDSGKPIGKNCALSAPPADAGEEGGHGVFLQVYPRKKDIGAGYSGCQAVFVKASDGPKRQGWLIVVVRGDPVRIWSADEEMRPMLDCRYQHGTLVKGTPQSCRTDRPLLLLSMPAGCMQGPNKETRCKYDAE